MISPEWIFKTPFLIRECLFCSSLLLHDSISSSMLCTSMLYSSSSVGSCSSEALLALIRGPLLFARSLNPCDDCLLIGWCLSRSCSWSFDIIGLSSANTRVVSVERPREDSAALSNCRGSWLSSRLCTRSRCSWTRVGTFLLLKVVREALQKQRTDIRTCEFGPRT